jgi:hypothetical protein
MHILLIMHILFIRKMHGMLACLNKQFLTIDVGE